MIAAAGTLARVEPRVACEGLTKRFGGVVAVDRVGVEVLPGEILALLGPSGCGKTTLLRLIAGFDRPDAGAVSLGGRVVSSQREWLPAERRHVGFVFQDYALFPHMTVAANVAFGVGDRGARATRVATVLDLVGLPHMADRYPHELSGGEQQRVALARALAPDPAIVLLDEPFSNLDADLRARVRAEVRAIIRRAGATALFVTHDQEEALEIADRVAVMNAGRIEQVGTPSDVYHVPGSRFVAGFVGEATFVRARIEHGLVRSSLGDFSIADVEDGDVEMLVRPEHVHVDAGGDAVVVASRFRGAITLTDVQLPGGEIVRAGHASHLAVTPGAPVTPRFEPDHIVVFRGDRRLAAVPARRVP